eukprot:TRINITY_DN34134_c0_g1_i1.p1 TRINITY_DN34134_c0_g1~~TRINITY_DN34134_c0_g1_i1.p1  ORF type:complete len:104 (-),score=27.24 TRINITY_DN34134_c0_g1_i1:517-828(-)
MCTSLRKAACQEEVLTLQRQNTILPNKEKDAKKKNKEDCKAAAEKDAKMIGAASLETGPTKKVVSKSQSLVAMLTTSVLSCSATAAKAEDRSNSVVFVADQIH